MVKLQEAENQIVIAYEVHDQRPNDADLLIAAVTPTTHKAILSSFPVMEREHRYFRWARGQQLLVAWARVGVAGPNATSISASELAPVRNARRYDIPQRGAAWCMAHLCSPGRLEMQTATASASRRLSSTTGHRTASPIAVCNMPVRSSGLNAVAFNPGAALNRISEPPLRHRRRARAPPVRPIFS
jgi:hypothetical protein